MPVLGETSLCELWTPERSVPGRAGHRDAPGPIRRISAGGVYEVCVGGWLAFRLDGSVEGQAIKKGTLPRQGKDASLIQAIRERIRAGVTVASRWAYTQFVEGGPAVGLFPSSIG